MRKARVSSSPDNGNAQEPNETTRLGRQSFSLEAAPMSKSHGALSSRFALPLVATIFLFALAAPAHAQAQGCPPVRLTVVTGNDLYALIECRTTGPCDGDRALGFTVGYIHGVGDALKLEGRIRSGGGITIGQLVDIVEK